MLLPAYLVDIFAAGYTVYDMSPGILPADWTLHLLPPVFLKISNPNFNINRQPCTDLILNKEKKTHNLGQGYITE